MHLAAALGKPGVAIFGPTDPLRNGPFHSRLAVLRADGAKTTYQRRDEVESSMRAIVVGNLLAASCADTSGIVRLVPGTTIKFCVAETATSLPASAHAAHQDPREDPGALDRLHLQADLAVVQQSARLRVSNPRPIRDGFIAATALVHGMTVVTRNVADFESMGVPLLNPWQT